MGQQILTLAQGPGLGQHARGAVRHGDRTEEGGRRGGEEIAERRLHHACIGTETRQCFAFVREGHEPMGCGTGRKLSPGRRVDDLIDPVAPAIERPKECRLLLAGVAPAHQFFGSRATQFDQQRGRPGEHRCWQPRREQALERAVGVPRVGRQQRRRGNAGGVHCRARIHVDFNAVTTPVFGSSIRRVEDPHLIRGAGRYVDDLQPEGCLHLVFLRSHLAHATIARVDLAAARQARGVVAVWSAADLKNLKPLQIEEGVEGMARPERGVLASDRVRHAGEAVAMLVAESLAEARDALELIELDLEPLPVVTDMERALQEDAPLLYPELETNIAFRKELKRGAVKRSFDQADVVVRERLVNQRLIPAPLEPRGAVGWMDGGRLTLQVSSQSTYGVREAVANNLGLVEDVGGGFGSKGGCMAEEIAVAEAARRLDGPVKRTEERWENSAVTSHGRG